MVSVSDTITNSATYTALNEAKNRVTGAASSKLDQADFLKLLTQQLQYQDPMEPMDNSQFVSQTNQFSQLETLNSMSSNMSTNNSIMQTLSLVGKQVDLINPDDTSKTITGTVSESKFNSTGATIVVDGKEYPISTVTAVRNVTTSS